LINNHPAVLVVIPTGLILLQHIAGAAVSITNNGDGFFSLHEQKNPSRP
jgi:hypothetical protein